MLPINLHMIYHPLSITCKSFFLQLAKIRTSSRIEPRFVGYYWYTSTETYTSTTVTTTLTLTISSCTPVAASFSYDVCWKNPSLIVNLCSTRDIYYITFVHYKKIIRENFINIGKEPSTFNKWNMAAVRLHNLALSSEGGTDFI